MAEVADPDLQIFVVVGRGRGGGGTGGLPLDNKISTDQFIDTGQSHR